MTRRYPSGLISPTTFVTTADNASGIFDIPTQMQLKNSQLWPTKNTNFNSTYQNLINNFSGTKYYVSTTGSDTNDGLSENTAFQSYARFYAVTSALTTNIMCIFLPGTYTLSSITLASDCEVCISDNSYPRTYVCSPGKTIFQWTASAGKRDCAPLNFNNAGSNIYGATIKRNNNSRTLNYSVAFFNNTTANFLGKAYNTVFQETNANGNWSMNYANSGFPTGSEVNYSTFAVVQAALSSYSGTGLVLNNCAGNYTYTTSSSTFNNWVTANGTMDPTSYYIAGASGVYNGTYAWTN